MEYFVFNGDWASDELIPANYTGMGMTNDSRLVVFKDSAIIRQQAEYVVVADFIIAESGEKKRLVQYLYLWANDKDEAKKELLNFVNGNKAVQLVEIVEVVAEEKFNNEDVTSEDELINHLPLQTDDLDEDQLKMLDVFAKALDGEMELSEEQKAKIAELEAKYNFNTDVEDDVDFDEYLDDEGDDRTLN